MFLQPATHPAPSRLLWVEATVGTGYELYIVQRQGLKQDVVANAAAFQAGLKESGHVEIPGIFFDSNKTVVKPESDAALKEVVKLLQTNPQMRVWVVGHTANVGRAHRQRGHGGSEP